MLLPSPMTNPWAGNGSANARTRNAASTTVAETARVVADLEAAPTSRRPPSEMQITDCTAPLLCGQALVDAVGSRSARADSSHKRQTYGSCIATIREISQSDHIEPGQG